MLYCANACFYIINQFGTNLSDWFPSVTISEETVSSSVLDTAMITCTVDVQQNQTVYGFTSKTHYFILDVMKIIFSLRLLAN